MKTMKTMYKPFLSVLLTLCIIISTVICSYYYVAAATADEPVGFEGTPVFGNDDDWTYHITVRETIQEVYLDKYLGTDTNIIIPDYFGNPRVYGETWGISRYCFENKDIKSVRISQLVRCVYPHAFSGCESLSTVVFDRMNTEVAVNSFPSKVKYIYLPRLPQSKFKQGIFNESPTGYDGPTDFYFVGTKEEYLYYFGDNYPETEKRKIHYNTDLSTPVGTTRIVSDDFKLDLANVNGNIESGEIALAAGTYEFNIHKGDIFRALKGNNVLGYGKTVNDNTTGSLSYNARYKSKTTLVASGGVYSFRFDKSTNKLTIKRTADLPEVYLKGNPDLSAFREAPINLILSRINGTNLSIGTCSLPAAEYNFKLVKNGVEMGCETDTDFVASSPATVSENGSGNLKYSAGHETFTFIYNHDTNQVSCKSISDMDVEKSADTISVLGSGINLVLTDNNGQSSTATGTVRLQSGMYNFKLYNKGTPYAGNFVYYDNGFKNIKSTYNTPITLMASGGLYRFTYYKYSGAFNIQKI